MLTQSFHKVARFGFARERSYIQKYMYINIYAQ